MTLPAVLGLDTNCFVYGFETAGLRAEYLAREVFQRLIAGTRHAVTSTLTIAEVLVPSLRAGLIAGARERETTLTTMPNLSIVSVDARVAFAAARIRAECGLRLADAVQVATAIVGGAEAFLTNDRQILRAAGQLSILILDDMIND